MVMVYIYTRPVKPKKERSQQTYMEPMKENRRRKLVNKMKNNREVAYMNDVDQLLYFPGSGSS
jgi:hypothetical protein